MIFKLRPREKSKEIQPDLKFGVKTGMERLEEQILAQKQYFDTSDPPDSNKKNSYKNYFGVEKKKFSGGKQVLDYYHFKTYFKTIESLALDLHSSVRNMSRKEINKKRNDEKLGMNDRGIFHKPTIENTVAKEDIMPISSEIMEKYGLWNYKRSGSGSVDKRRFGTPI